VARALVAKATREFMDLLPEAATASPWLIAPMEEGSNRARRYQQ